MSPSQTSLTSSYQTAIIRLIFSSANLALLSGCAGLSQIQDSLSHLDQGAHAAATAESEFLTALRQSDCNSQFFSSAYTYALNASAWDKDMEHAKAESDAAERAASNAQASHAKDAQQKSSQSAAAKQRLQQVSQSAASSFKLVKYCAPKVISDQEMKLRNQMMAALSLYADKLLALASTSDDKSLDTNAQTLAGDLKTTVKNGGVTLRPADGYLVAGVTAAFTAIAEMALDEKKYKGAIAAAKAMQPHIDALSTALTKENDDFSTSIVAGNIVLEGQLRAMVAVAPGATAKFDEILQARDILTSSTGVALGQLATQDWSTETLSKPVNDTLSSVKSANDAVAAGKTGGVYAAAHDLYERATAAKTTYAAINK